MNEKIYIFIIIIFFFSTVKATTIVDFETEIFIKDVIELIREANKLEKDISFTVILDDDPNAFINENNHLIISTGLIKYSTSYETIVGVIAHEIGHIENYHISKRKNSSIKLKKVENLTNLSIIAGSIFTKNSNYLIQSIMSNQLGINNYFQAFSREQEREADQYAINTMNKLKISKIPLLSFIRILEKKSLERGITEDYFKFSSHPIFKERLKLIENLTIDNDLYFDKELNISFNFLKAKYFGYTESNEKNLIKHLAGDYYNYAKAIIFSKKGRLIDSMKNLNILITKYSNNSFILETKADLLYSNGYLKESLLFYKKVLERHNYNYYALKRMFNIDFTLIKNNNKYSSMQVFNIYLKLLKHTKNVVIIDKFLILAKNSNLYNWEEYLLNEKKYYNKKISKKVYIQNMKLIKINSINSDVMSFIEHKIISINENI